METEVGGVCNKRRGERGDREMGWVHDYTERGVNHTG